ncbi:hypothetical protein [Wenzhouxiangella sp. XN24]|uniref:hypothetical protein n=1 Tax=Wenzhouxiangella sp. XN24 TaxID=2713569 RepID=UPI0013EB1E2F|nr:hypothetical protein [Wenzhouxiangella sp. XN24]NGX15839.1 hypothetical protein [Wenzhouxiangella sp. XN24]
MSLIAELKRRKVVRVAVVYAATAFAVLQGADIMLPRMGVPDWGMNLVVALTVLGFPIALVLAWALELTPEGLRVTPTAAAEESDDSASTPALLGKRTLAVAAGLLLLGIGLGAGWFLRPPVPPADPPSDPPAVAERPAPTPATAPQSENAAATETQPVRDLAVEPLARGVAVLPFENLSEDPANAFFAGGVHEEVLTSLSLIADLRVISRTSMLRIAESQLDVPAMAQRLGVSHVLEGSVRRAGNRVRVTVQLIDAALDEHLWAENYDRELDDIFAIQSDIARAIAEQLRIELSPREAEALAERPTENSQAHDLYLRALDRRRAFFGIDGWRAQIALLEQALVLDPEFLQARLMLVEAHGRMFWDGADTAGSHVARTRELVEEISRRWPDRPEALLSQAMYLYLVESDYAGALEACQEILSLRPNDAWVHSCIAASHKRLNQREENLVAARRWLEIDPETGVAWFELFNALAQLGRGEEAIEVVDRARALFPENTVFDFWRAFYVLAFRGDIQSILALAGRANEYTNSVIAEALFASGDVERALAVLAPAAGGYDLEAVHDDLLRAELLIYAERGEEARSHARRAYDYLEDRGETEFAALPPRGRGAAYALAAAVAAAAGERQSAAEWSRRAQSEPRLDITEDRNRLAELARAASLLGDHDAAWAHYTDAARASGMMMTPGLLRAFRSLHEARFGQSAAYQAHMAGLDSEDGA